MTIEVRIEGRDLLEVSINRYSHHVGREPDRGADEGRVRGRSAEAT